MKSRLIFLFFIILALVIFGLLWAFIFGPANPNGFGWYLFAYAMGLTMIVLPCTLPLAFVIVPLSMGKGPVKGLGLALSFGLGVAITLSLYGVLAAIVGQVAIGSLNAPLETVKNWVYFIAGAFAYLFALGEIGLVKYRLPSYTGAAPAFIQKQSDYLKALLLGMFLGNIGIGCPHPATPLILAEIASSGDVFYGWSLFLVHALGRILPLLLLALLGIIGVNALSWLVARKDKIERGTGWAMVFVAGFLIVLGFSTHAWWVNSGLHTALESLTQEERFLGVLTAKLGVAAPHHHGLETGTGLLGLPLSLGNWLLVLLWIIPLWWYHRKKKDEPERWRLPFIVATSLLLALTFIYVIPDRFRRQATPELDLHDEAMPAMMMAEADHGATGLAVDLTANPPMPRVGIPADLQFFVNRQPGNQPVPINELEIEREKLMHVIGVRSDLNYFFHIHPQPGGLPGEWSVSNVFEAPGQYKIWSEIKQAGTIHNFDQPLVTVVGDDQTALAPDTNFSRQVTVDTYKVELTLPSVIQAEREAELGFEIHSLAGQEISLGNYLGAPVHLSVIKDDLSQFVHTHPGDRAGASHGVEFPVVFPEPGLYKVFAQFRPADSGLPPDEALMASFWIKVAEIGPAAGQVEDLSWSAKLLISAILIVVLSLFIRRLLRVA